MKKLLPVLCLLLVSCSKKEEAPPSLNSEAPKARYYYDLGPATIDVSGYPKKQQENYKLFLTICNACHTAARALNAPYTKEAQWKRFVHRMHLKMEGRGITLSSQDEARIVEFLAYDSQIRKLAAQEKFEAAQNALKGQFEEAK